VVYTSAIGGGIYDVALDRNRRCARATEQAAHDPPTASSPGLFRADPALATSWHAYLEHPSDCAPAASGGRR
jgi:hypothetical protein